MGADRPIHAANWSACVREQMGDVHERATLGMAWEVGNFRLREGTFLLSFLQTSSKSKASWWGRWRSKSLPYPLKQVMVNTGNCMGTKYRAGTPGKVGSSQPIVLYQWTRLIPVISCQCRALSSLVLSAQIKLMKRNPLKCPGCISVTGLRIWDGKRGESRGSLCHGGETSPLCQTSDSNPCSLIH